MLSYPIKLETDDDTIRVTLPTLTAMKVMLYQRMKARRD